MSNDTLAIAIGVALWVPFLFLVAQDFLRSRKQRRLERRALDLTEPKGRARLGITNEEE